MRLGFPRPTGLRSLALLGVLITAPLGGLAHAQRSADLAPSLSITSRVGTLNEPLRPDQTGFIFSIAASPIVLPASGKVAFHVGVSGFTLDLSLMNKKVVFGEGHYHVYVDSIDQTHPFGHYTTCACDGIATPTMTFNLSAAFIAKKT